MIIRSKTLVTMDGPPIDNGAVAILGECIVGVGQFSEIIKERAGEEVVDLAEQVLLPGLINAHCHLEYTWLRRRIPRPHSFAGWIRSINAEKATRSADDYVTSTNEGFLEAKRFGTTTLANLTGFPELIPRVEALLRTWWFRELIDVRDPSRANAIVDVAVEQLKSQQHWGLAPHAPFTASAALYRRCEQIAARQNVLLATHLAESPEEMEMFRHGKGELYDFLKQIGRDMSDCGRATPVRLFLEQAIEGNPAYLLVHVNDLVDDDDVNFLRNSALEFSIVHCPRSHEYFGHSPFQFDTLRKSAINICLGTDSLASNEDLSLFAEMRAFARNFPNTSPREIVQMVTVNPARALNQEKALGKIRVGFFADLIALPIVDMKSVFEEAIAFVGPVSWSMVGGRIAA